MGYDDVDPIHLVQDRNQWKTPVNMVMILRVSEKAKKCIIN
jgi:hypothetical protein